MDKQMTPHTVQVSMDGLRRNLTRDAEELGEHLKSMFDDMMEHDKEEIIERFDQLACGLNSLNCIEASSDDKFNMMDDVEVTLLGNHD